MSQQPPIYITTPLYYVNDELHIGHATTTLYADALARFWRACGRPVLFLTGSDEHGQKIFKKAKEKGIEPRAFADDIVGKFFELWEKLDVSYDIFIRTTDEFHERTVQALFSRLQEKGLVYKGKFQGLYCVGCESYKTEKDLVDGRCPAHGTPPETLEEENWFFKLSAFEQPLKDLLEREPERIQPPNRRNEILGKLREGLADTSISRTQFDWGVRMPGDEQHVIWVWFDALINYISALGWPEGKKLPTFAIQGRSRSTPPQPPAGEGAFDYWWPASVHLLGKEIFWHHTVVWWSMLMGADVSPPSRVFAHGWWTVEGEKMSKTLGNVIRPGDFADRYGRDALRYYVLRAGPTREDADWRQADFMTRYNADLANGLGNLVNRSLKMLEKYFEGRVPVETPFADAGLEALRQAIVERVGGLAAQMRAKVEAVQLDGALEAIWELVRQANRFVDETKPFKLAKEPERAQDLQAAMHTLAETVRVLGAAIAPFLPDAGDKIARQLDFAESGALDEQLRWGRLPVDHRIGVPEALFQRLEETA